MYIIVKGYTTPDDFPYYLFPNDEFIQKLFKTICKSHEIIHVERAAWARSDDTTILLRQKYDGFWRKIATMVDSPFLIYFYSPLFIYNLSTYIFVSSYRFWDILCDIDVYFDFGR